MWGLHDEYQGAWKVATSQGVVFLLNLHTMHQLWFLLLVVQSHLIQNLDSQAQTQT